MTSSFKSCISHTGIQTHCRRSLARIASKKSNAEVLLDTFWSARGVVNEEHRHRLIEVGKTQTESIEEEDLLSEQMSLPGLSSTWFLKTAQGGEIAPEALPGIVATSRRLLALMALLGGRGDIDVAFMVEREPGLLSTDTRELASRLLELRVAAQDEEDIILLVESQPSLLLGKGSISPEESADDRSLAWHYGLMNDASEEWGRKFELLQQYQEKFGDVHVGFRGDEDPPELARWATKQRATKDRMSEQQKEILEHMGFEFDDERAEWLRWFHELKGYKEANGHCNPVPLAAGSDFLLLNWCAIQRIAKRSRVLKDDRISLLDSIGFDWTGADALS